MSHSGGYFTETEYEVFRAFPPMNPAHMNFLCSFKGVRVPDFSEPFSYCELGAGQGFGLAMLAALYPHGRFVGVDFSASQIKRAQAFADAIGLDNIVFIEASFADFAREAEADFDVIAAHGVWTWVSHEVRADILTLVDKMLAPGGLLHVSMNTMPGWASVAPFQRLIMDMWREMPERDPRLLRATFKHMMELQPKSLQLSVRAKQLIEQALQQHESYFQHEFLNESWEPVYFRDIAAQLEPLGLVYAAGGRVRDIVDRLYLTGPQRELLATIGNTAMRETLKDFYRDETFRQDHFVRSPAELSQGEQFQRLASCPVVLLSDAKLKFNIVKTADGDVRLDEKLHKAWSERLKAGPATVHELITCAEAAEAGLAVALQTLTFMQSLGAIDVGFGDPHEQAVRERATRFNVKALDLLGDSVELQLASPVLRTPIAMEVRERIYLSALAAGRDPAEEVIRITEATGGEISDGGKVITGRAAKREAMTKDYRAFAEGRLPILRQLGVAEAFEQRSTKAAGRHSA